MTQTPVKTGNVFLLTGFFIVNMIACTLLLSSFTFFCKGSISFWQFPAAIILSVILNIYACKYFKADRNVMIISLISIAVVIIGSLLISCYFYDVSYDGQAYHQEAIYQLKNGWNPYFTTMPDSVNQVLYINHYSKGVELSQSAIYSTFHHIEAGKATNIMLLIAAFCLTLSYLYKLNELSPTKRMLLSLVLVLNPVAVNQLLTYYVDGQLATMILCLIITLLMVIRDPNRYNLILLGAIIIVTVNIKFTAVVFTVIFVAAALTWLIFTKKRGIAKKTFYACLVAGIIGIGMVGYNPYVVNTVKYQHPFYPLMGKNKIDIISNNQPTEFGNKNEAGKFFASIFSHTGNMVRGDGQVVHLKIPLTFNKSDIINAPKVDTRIAGFGPLFSGILIISLVLLIILLATSNKPLQFKNILYLLAVIVVSICIIPDCWWARYVPQLWFIPVIILFASELGEKSTWTKILKPLIYTLIIINISFCFINIGWNFLMTNLINYQLAELKASKKTILVQWGAAKSNRIRFEENHIPYLETNLDNKKAENMAHSDSKFLLPDDQPVIPESTLIKWARKYQVQDEK
jgi:hypothetical protein